MTAVPAAIWLLGLYAAAPALRAGPNYSFPDRLCDALILGVAIPFALGFVHALYWGACWGALLLCIAIAAGRSLNERNPTSENTARPAPYLLIAALLLVAWPQLTRPLLDGDSLSYHLPNAAAWVHAHSLWTATTRYWWYPPASELFASALYAVGSPFALPWCGFCALALLGFRIAAWSREALSTSPLLADALAAATVSAFPRRVACGLLARDAVVVAHDVGEPFRARRRPDGLDQTTRLDICSDRFAGIASASDPVGRDFFRSRPLGDSRRDPVEERRCAAGSEHGRRRFLRIDPRARPGSVRATRSHRDSSLSVRAGRDYRGLTRPIDRPTGSSAGMGCLCCGPAVFRAAVRV